MPKRLLLFAAVAALAAATWGIHARASRSRMNSLPSTTLWAWQRPENLSFIDPRKTSVAVLAATINLQTPEATVEHREQPISMPPDTNDIAVYRIQAAPKVVLTDEMRRRAAYEVCEDTQYTNPKAVQIDFDARVSQREFYRALLKQVRGCLPNDMPLSMTALVSWCEGDDWISDLPVDEAVPMYFRMGVDEQNIRRSHMDVKHLREPLCRNSVGVSLDEPWPRFDTGTRVYAFAPTAWTEVDYQRTLERLAR
jgi:hypothetical protein